MKSFVVLPGVGIGLIRFGLTPGQVQSTMREEMVYESWMGGNLNDALLYHGLRFHFDRYNGSGPLEDGRLSEIYVCGREEASLFDKPLMQWDRPSVVDAFRANAFNVVTFENGDITIEEPFIEVSFGDSGLISWFGMVAKQS